MGPGKLSSPYPFASFPRRATSFYSVMIGRSALSKYRISRSRAYSTIQDTFQSSVLKNGIRVATNPQPGHFSATGLYVDAGSRYESEALQGVSHLVDRLAFKSTKNFTGPEMLKTLELLGGNYQCISSRESLMYQSAVFNKDIEKMFQLLSETVGYPKITEEELEEQKFTATYEVAEIWQRPDLLLPELLHSAAYNNKTLGSPLVCPQDRIPFITNSLIEEYRSRLYNPESITAAFVGIPHSTAVEYAEKYLGNLKQVVPKLKPDVSKYTGGTLDIPSLEGYEEPLTHVYIAFEGLSFDDPDVYALAVLQTLIGGGGSFSAGGPGKGMYSRAYTQVLNQYYFVESCQSFNHSYTDSGLFGISITGSSQYAQHLPRIICEQFLSVMQTGDGSLQKTEVERAKKQLRSGLLMNLESKMVELEDLGRQMQVRGSRVPIKDVVTKIESLTIEDIRRVAQRVLKGNANNVGKGTGKPTVVTLGYNVSSKDITDLLKFAGLGNN